MWKREIIDICIGYCCNGLLSPYGPYIRSTMVGIYRGCATTLCISSSFLLHLILYAHAIILYCVDLYFMSYMHEAWYHYGNNDFSGKKNVIVLKTLWWCICQRGVTDIGIGYLVVYGLTNAPWILPRSKAW